VVEATVGYLTEAKVAEARVTVPLGGNPIP